MAQFKNHNVELFLPQQGNNNGKRETNLQNSIVEFTSTPCIRFTIPHSTIQLYLLPGMSKNYNLQKLYDCITGNVQKLQLFVKFV